MLDGLSLVLVEFERLHDQFVALDDLSCSEKRRISASLGVVFYEIGHSMDASVHRTTVIILIAEVLPSGSFLVRCDVDSMVNQLLNTLILGS